MILEREQRASDLATKADRDISPKLTDEQYHALLYYTFKAGFKHPAQLLEAFVGDLSGWHRNGSDEEELAGEWFSRAYSGMGGSDSFLSLSILRLRLITIRKRCMTKIQKKTTGRLMGISILMIGMKIT